MSGRRSQDVLRTSSFAFSEEPEYMLRMSSFELTEESGCVKNIVLSVVGGFRTC